MDSKKKLALVTNVALALIIVVVGAVCFIPLGISTAGGKSDGVYYNGNTDSDMVSLMFNVYQGSEYVLDIMDTLDEYGARATFFVGGSWVDDNTEILRAIASRGHEIGNHGYFHKDHDKLNAAENRQEIYLCGELVRALTDVRVELFAPPSGAYSRTTVEVAEELGYKVIMWSKDTIDWRDHDEQVVFNRATQKVAGGDLILMHPTKHTAAALSAVLEYYRESALRAVSVSENISGIEKV